MLNGVINGDHKHSSKHKNKYKDQEKILGLKHVEETKVLGYQLNR